MNDLISRKALIAEYDRVHIGPPGGARKLMEDAPSVDAVEVVRCKDCIHFDGQHYIGGGETGKVYCYGYCYHWDYEEGMSPNQVDADDFCSYGERRDKDAGD